MAHPKRPSDPTSLNRSSIERTGQSQTAIPRQRNRARSRQWEPANYKPEYNFVVRQYMIGKGLSVSVLWRGGELDTIFGFDKEADALEWIRENRRRGF